MGFIFLGFINFASSQTQQDFNLKFEQLGQSHNEFLEMIFTKTVDNKLSMCEKKGYKIYNTWSHDFFEAKGIEFNDDFVDYYLKSNLENQILYPQKNFSIEANQLLKSLESLLD